MEDTMQMMMVKALKTVQMKPKQMIIHSHNNILNILHREWLLRTLRTQKSGQALYWIDENYAKGTKSLETHIKTEALRLLETL